MWICVLFFLVVVVFVLYALGQVHLRLRHADAQVQRRLATSTPRAPRRLRIIKVRKVPPGTIRTMTFIKYKISPKEV